MCTNFTLGNMMQWCGQFSLIRNNESIYIVTIKIFPIIATYSWYALKARMYIWRYKKVCSWNVLFSWFTDNLLNLLYWKISNQWFCPNLNNGIILPSLQLIYMYITKFLNKTTFYTPYYCTEASAVIWTVRCFSSSIILFNNVILIP